ALPSAPRTDAASTACGSALQGRCCRKSRNLWLLDFSAEDQFIRKARLDLPPRFVSGLHIALANAQLPLGQELLLGLHGAEISSSLPEKDFFDSIGHQHAFGRARHQAGFAAVS
ncbi:MAG: hypothetical protein ACE5EU_10335, partial [Paracoccaceae bacterium]